MKDQVQCECGGWMNPHAIYCPTCGGPVAVAVHEISKPNLGWQIVRIFWGGVLVAFVLLMIVG